ncbi:MAG: hypothetical protein AB2705_19215 [Candidatus Thiodiazotropha sp.]
MGTDIHSHYLNPQVTFDRLYDRVGVPILCRRFDLCGEALPAEE